MLSCFLNILQVTDLPLILLNTSWGIYSIPKESKYRAMFPPINNKTQYVPLLLLSSRFITYAPYFTVSNFFFEKTPLNLGFWLKRLVTLILFKEFENKKPQFFIHISSSCSSSSSSSYTFYYWRNYWLQKLSG